MLVNSRLRDEIARLTKAKGLQVLVVFTLLSSLMPPQVRVHTANDGLVESTLESVVASEFWGNRTISRVPPEEVVDAVSRLQYLPGEEELPFEALEMEMDPRMPPFISAERATEDVERLFYLLENGYSGYGYFQGMGSFHKAEARILGELRRQPVWNAEELSSLIHEHLGFLRDRHLDIGGRDYGGHEDFWFDEGFELREEGGEYIFTSEGAEYTVASINGGSPDGYLFPSLNADGEAILRLGMLSRSSPQPLELEARSGQGTRRWRVKLQRSQPRYPGMFEEKTVGGVPVVRIRSFGDHPKEYKDGFLASASRYRGEPCLVVDVRGNGGGNEAWPRQWVTRFTGRQPERMQVFTELISETAMIGRANSYALALHSVPELSQQGYPAKVEEFRGYAESIEEGGIAPYWWPYDVPGPREIPSDTTLIVLVDANVYSSGEGFISYLHQVENVVLVGENSGGAVTYGQMSHHRLPNSKMLVGLPTSLNVFVDLEYREERGFFPDLWVPAGEALNYAVAAVRRGTIATSPSYREEIMGAAFVPEEPPMKEKVFILLPIVTAVIYGVFPAYFNRKRRAYFFILCGIAITALGYFLLSREPPLGYVCFLLGLEYLVIALYKWRRARKAPETHK
jgi:hypothetical protein